MKRILILAALLVLSAVPMSASTFVHMDDLDMVRSTQAVVEGQIVDVQSFWTESGRLIATEAKVIVSDVLVGQASKILTVRTWGGTVGDITVEAAGFPRFEKDSRVILFVEKLDDEDFFRVTNYQRGHYKIVTRLDGVTLAVPQTDGEARMLKADGSLAPAPQSVGLDQFKANLRGLATKAGRLHR